MAEIPIYGTLVNATTDPKIVNTDQAWDKELGKYQSEINQERIESNANLKTQLDTLNSKVDKEITDRGSADTALGAKIDKEIQDRTDADNTLKTELTGDIQEVQEALNNFIATKAQANGLATLGSDGKVPASQLPSYVDDVVEVYATYDKSATGELSNIALFADEDHTMPVTGEAGKIYLNITSGEPGYQFRWTGTAWAPITSGGLVIGEISGTAFDGARGKKLETFLYHSTPGKIINDIFISEPNWNPLELVLKFEITRRQTDTDQGYHENYFNHLTLPGATESKAGLFTGHDYKMLYTTLPKQISDETAAREASIDGLQENIAQEVVDRNAAIANAKTELTTAINKEVSDRKSADDALKEELKAVIEAEKEELSGADITLQNNITKEVNDRKGEITRVEKLISDEAATRAQADTDTNAKIDSHIANKSNPHGVTKAQVGLGNVNNTSDADKPVSTAQATAIADAKAAGTNAQTNLTTHTRDTSNPHQVNRDQIGLGSTQEITFKKVSAPSGLWKESDIRLKSFIKPLEHTLDEICSIPTDSFMIRGNHDIGTIAQTIEKHFPELVSENAVKPEMVPNPDAFEKVEKDGEAYVLVKEVDYSKMSVLAIEGIKLLKAEIEELKKKLLFTNLD